MKATCRANGRGVQWEEARRLNLRSTIYENGAAGDRMLFDGDWRVHKSPQGTTQASSDLESLFVDLNTVTDLPDPIEICALGRRGQAADAG